MRETETRTLIEQFLTGKMQPANNRAHTIRRLKPDGAFRNPFIAWKTPPPMHPIANAPPQSSTILYGHGSRAYSSIIYFWLPVTTRIRNWNEKERTNFRDARCTLARLFRRLSEHDRVNQTKAIQGIRI